MAFEDFFNHTCTLYHIKKDSCDMGYGITSDDKFTYPDTPEEKDTDIPCHFHVKSGQYQIVQEEPLNKYGARVKLSLPLGTDIRVNDKIVSGVTGFEYIAELPRQIQNHHIIVYANRRGSAKEAI